MYYLNSFMYRWRKSMHNMYVFVFIFKSQKPAKTQIFYILLLPTLGTFCLHIKLKKLKIYLCMLI